MCNQTHNPSNNPEPQRLLKAPKIQRLQAVFNILKPTANKKILVCSGLTGEQALTLIDNLRDNINTPLIVKFDGMKEVL